MLRSEEQVFAALADDMRRQLLLTLAASNAKTATQLAQNFPITRQGIMKHLDLLTQAGLVQTETKGRERLYSFAPSSLDSVRLWIDEINARWQSRLQNLKELVEKEDK